MPPIRNYQHRPQCQTPYRQDDPHPSIGLGYWYPYPLRQLAISAKDIGCHRDPVILAWNQNNIWPCCKTIYNWRKRRHNQGHYNLYQRTRNSRATVLRGLEAFQMTCEKQNHGHRKYYQCHLTLECWHAVIGVERCSWC